MDWIQQWQSKLNKQNGVAPLVRTGGSRHTGLAALPHRNIHIKFAHEKRREGLTISDIALLLHSSPKTIQKYLAIPEDQVPKSKEIVRERQHQLAVKQKEQEIEEATFRFF